MGAIAMGFIIIMLVFGYYILKMLAVFVELVFMLVYGVYQIIKDAVGNDDNS